MRDGKALRHEIRENGEWRNRVVDKKTGSEWVMRAKEQVLVESNEEGRAKGREYRMPELEAARGMIVGYRTMYLRGGQKLDGSPG
jgi:hypothetical protein